MLGMEVANSQKAQRRVQSMLASLVMAFQPLYIVLSQGKSALVALS